MKRRTLLEWLAVAAGTLPFPKAQVWAQTNAFPGKQTATLKALASFVLPAELGAGSADKIAGQFERWVRDYRPGADTDHGYGHTSVRPKGPSPALVYSKQLEELRLVLASKDAVAKCQAIEAALVDANIRDLPRVPDGRHIITDLMSFYFRGADANDLCYRAAIGRDKCRGLEGSDQPPAPLAGPGKGTA